MSANDRQVVLIVGGARDLTGRITRVLAEAGFDTPVIASDDLRQDPMPERLDRDVVNLKAAVACCEPLIERHRPERDWKQRERQRPSRRKRR